MKELEKHEQSQFEYVGFWKRVLISLIDFVILTLPLIYLYRFSSQLAYSLQSIVPFFFDWGLFISFIIFLTAKFGGTPGKLFLKARIVDESGNYLSLNKSAIRTSFLILNGSILIGMRIASFFHYEINLLEQISVYIFFIILSDFLVIVFNKRKRAIHDYLAGSFVVTKKSLNKHKYHS